MLAFLLITLSFAKVDFSIVDYTHCGGKALYRLYAIDKCKKTGTGSVMYTNRSPSEYYPNQNKYSKSDCTGTPSTMQVVGPQYVKEAPSGVKYLGFLGDKNVNCADGDTIDGVYYTDACFQEDFFFRYTILNEDGKNKLVKRGFTSGVCAEDQFNEDITTERNECNKCTDGVLFRCYGVDGVAAWSDPTEKAPEVPSDKPSGDHSETDDENNNQENSAIPVYLCIILVVFAVLI
ncbi:hypothetical protein EIN_139560 [Entamoeba invadens IP1]|uniref:Uncharacterized protein n=1 Tax=Entamoeba invadens IP1 TaxID=370355 RepID=A0A0A1TXB3_ENTIV|nr:hypothetical protein EIN_139560 [Entamoeba invadens IP1]ELP84129.1 hypothetical protein EIN_139560 [Entamoeba invadens IP1]|eukprot:XP_004183475.1 hypothetical protein EIN_139560 [Entamoeba invadens IP1]